MEPRAFPRTLRFGRHRFGAYKVCLAAGLYFGTLASVLAAKLCGVAPVPFALATLACAVAGLVGARLFHLALFAARYRALGLRDAWNTSAGGGALFGGLLAVLLVSPVGAALVRLPFGVFWDLLSPALLVGAVCTRLGCFCHGCCGGRSTTSRLGLRWHDHRGEKKRRLPVQLLETAWLAAAVALFAWFFPRPHPAGALALGSIAWYGAGRSVLESFREEPDLVFGRVRINQLIAAALSVGAGGMLLLLVSR